MTCIKSKYPNISTFFFLLIIVCIIWGYDFLLFTKKIPSNEPVTNVSSDAIVVLTGGSGRIKKGLSLLKSNYADILFISGVNPKFKLNDIISELNINKKILLGRQALNTSGNAIEISRWADKENIKTIRLVTASYHMPRSLLEISYISPNLKIIPHPVFPEITNFKWWKNSETFSLFFMEYIKFLFSRLKYFLIFDEEIQYEN